MRSVVALGERAISLLEFLGGLFWLYVDAARQIPRGLIAGRSRRLTWQNLWAQMDRVGVRSIGIVSLVMFCIGAILALQMAPILRDFGMLSRVADVLSVSVFRELGPLVSAIVLTGFAGASIAAEIGTMVVSEEIEALQAEAIDPHRFLVLPRVMATTLMTVCVTIVGDIMGVGGGLVISRVFLGIEVDQYATHTFEILKMKDFVTGLIKAGVFGATISGLACFLGLGVTNGATGVGRATTKTVVFTIVGLILIDLMFTAFFYFLNL
jgi:phospholipid/cholesterol/gamma-HCH transport system permease protein